VGRIGAIANPVLRNLNITECYARLAAAFAAQSRGPGANWCTFATWASRQAGETIRGEDVLDDLQRRLSEGRLLLQPLQTLWRRLLRLGLLQPETRVGRLTAELHTPLDAVGRASDAVARGNLKVFAEVGLEFARRLEQNEPLERFLEGLSPGESPTVNGCCARRSCTTSNNAPSPTRRRMRSSACSQVSRSASTNRRGCKSRSSRR
jgi:hypothetical protein